MNHPFLAGRQDELLDLIARIDHDALNQAACRGLDPEIYHPVVGEPDAWAIERCETCVARLACLALALRAEPSDARHGWYGGLGPVERAAVAEELGTAEEENVPPGRASEAVRLHQEGWTINAIASELGCSRRTVQRYLRLAA
jgi:AraC-like DNA-binding protein